MILQTRAIRIELLPHKALHFKLKMEKFVELLGQGAFHDKVFFQIRFFEQMFGGQGTSPGLSSFEKKDSINMVSDVVFHGPEDFKVFGKFINKFKGLSFFPKLPQGKLILPPKTLMGGNFS